MTRRTRQIPILFCAGLLLLVQSLPAYVVCVCDESEGCGRACCAEGPVEPVSCCSDALDLDMTAGVSISAPCCDRAAVESGLSGAVLPADDSTESRLRSVSVVVLPGDVSGDASSNSIRTAGLRGPPAETPPPIYLLNNSFLI